MYVTSVLAGEKSGSLAEVLERFILYQRTALAIRKKVLVSLIYPTVSGGSGGRAHHLPGDVCGAELR